MKGTTVSKVDTLCVVILVTKYTSGELTKDSVYSLGVGIHVTYTDSTRTFDFDNQSKVGETTFLNQNLVWTVGQYLWVEETTLSVNLVPSYSLNEGFDSTQLG